MRHGFGGARGRNMLNNQKGQCYGSMANYLVHESWATSAHAGSWTDDHRGG